MILGDVEETITTVEIDDETYEEIIKVVTALCSRCIACEHEYPGGIDGHNNASKSDFSERNCPLLPSKPACTLKLTECSLHSACRPTSGCCRTCLCGEMG